MSQVERRSFAKLAIEQHWEHGRHDENERLWFTTIYAAITAAIYTILGESGFASELYPLLVAHIIISVLGLVVALKLSAEYHRRDELANRILEEYVPEFALRPIERSRPQGVAAKLPRQIFTVKNSFFQLYVFLVLSSISILLSFYSDTFPQYLRLAVPIEWTLIGAFVLLECGIVLVYAVILNKRIYFVRCTECHRVIRFDKLFGNVECVLCGRMMDRHEYRYVCRCGYAVRFDPKKTQVVCENRGVHKKKVEVSNEYRRIV
ncbi:MAG: hypothetical protein JSV12_01855 [Candidatus Bathyarchaeota archaeon]|nr:MAG: hypothetical protein JSV12_01855 [Candidatus Bathyarchaeota archaeon]